ncbi:MAG: sulfotransferase, partial [Planctomycetota bacterium]
MTASAAADTSATGKSVGRDPDFIVIGAMKAGTTTLYAHLQAHPQVFMADPKEPNYFSKDEVYQEKGRDWYRRLFADARPDQRCGEASPSYTRAPRFVATPERMAAEVPNAKLVYIMRHPVERFYSNYVFDRSFGFNEPIRATLVERPYVLETSRYIDQIRRYLEHFPAERLHCLLLDDLRSDLDATLRRLAAFLGIADFATADEANVRANERGEQHTKR